MLSIVTQKLNKIYLGKNKLLDKGANNISKLIKDWENLIHLDISSNGISSVGFKDIFASLYSNITLVSLNLSSSDRSHRNKLGPKGAKELAKLLRHSVYIQFLNLSSTALWNEGAKIVLDSVKENKILTSLILKSNEMTHVIAEDLSQAIIKSNLQYLDISHNFFGHAGIWKFWPVLQYSKWLLKILKLK